MDEFTDTFAVSDDIFRYAEPISPLPIVASKTKMPSPGSAMKPILPALGKPAKLPSPIPPDIKVMSQPHPEGVARPVVPKALRAGNPETLQQRIPRSKKPRYQLQVPMKEAFDRAHAEILGEMNKVSHPEDKQQHQEELDDLEKVFVSGSERLMTRFLEDHVGWKTFQNLVQSLKDEEPAMTSRPGIYGRANADIFRYEEPKPKRETRPENPKLSANAPPTHIPNIESLEAELPTGKAAPPKPPLRKMPLHPLPEKAADPWWHDTPHTNWLRHGEEISRAPLQSSGGTRNVWKINLGSEVPGHDYGAIWKARDDDNTAIARPWTIPEGNPHGHEAAAWEMAHILGMGGMVPPTVSRANRNQVGSAQHFVPDQDKAIRSPFPFGKPGNAQLPLAAAFDALTMNTDRHMGNWLVDPESSQLTLIDHGLLFPHTHKKPLVGNGEILGHAMSSGLPIPKETVQWVKEWPHLERSMKRNGLTDDQIALTQSRLFSLADAAAKGDNWRQWLKKSGIGSNYELR